MSERLERRRARLPQSSARATRRFATGGCSSPVASERRARKMSVSTAACDSSSSAAISRYERPCHSRRRIARRWVSGSCSSTSCSPISSSARRDGAGRQLLDDLEVGRRLDAAAAPRRAAARQADVVGDLEEPRRLELGHDAALDAAERVQERALHRVLGLLARAELVQAVAEDLVRVLLVERARRRPPREHGRLRRGSHDLWTELRPTSSPRAGRACGALRPSTPAVHIMGEASEPGQPVRKAIFRVSADSSPQSSSSGGGRKAAPASARRGPLVPRAVPARPSSPPEPSPLGVAARAVAARLERRRVRGLRRTIGRPRASSAASVSALPEWSGAARRSRLASRRGRASGSSGRRRRARCARRSPLGDGRGRS